MPETNLEEVGKLKKSGPVMSPMLNKMQNACNQNSLQTFSALYGKFFFLIFLMGEWSVIVYHVQPNEHCTRKNVTEKEKRILPIQYLVKDFFSLFSKLFLPLQNQTQ